MLSAVAALLLVQCPAPAAIEHKLQVLRAPGAVQVPYSLEVQHGDSLVVLTARRPDGDIWVQRELPANAPCDELEDAAAVVLLAWEAQLEPREVAPAPAPAVVPVVVASEPPPSLDVQVRARASGDVWLSSAAPTWGAAGAVEVHGKLIGLELGVLGQGRRDVALGSGRATWSRFTVSLGPVATIELTHGVDLSLGAALLTGVFFVSGSGFDQAFAVTDFDFGAAVQARLLLPGFWKLRPFAGVGGLAWLRGHVVQARTPNAEVTLPAFEANPMVGLVWTP